MADPVEQFLSRYERELDYYGEVARLASQHLNTRLRANGIRAMVTWRAKDPTRLRAKLQQRAPNQKYETEQQIYDDIVDLAGVRVALYFPGSRADVGKIIKSIFEVQLEKEFPGPGVQKKAFSNYTKKFDGYSAVHYRVRLPKEHLSESQQRYSVALVEIQVASVLMHAWSEVEHDLIYKPFQGELSVDEHSILDELNGTVLAGEIALERLQRAVEARVARKDATFSNHYELAAFLYESFEKSLKGDRPDELLGNVQSLFDLLYKLGKNSRDGLEGFLERIPSASHELPIAAQLSDLLLSDHPEYVEEFNRSQRLQSLNLAKDFDSDYDRKLGEFLKQWLQVECVAKSLRTDKSKPSGANVLKPLMDRIDESSQLELGRLRLIRNLLMHGDMVPAPEFLKQATESCTTLLTRLAKKDDEVRKGLEDCADRLNNSSN